MGVFDIIIKVVAELSLNNCDSQIKNQINSSSVIELGVDGFSPFFLWFLLDEFVVHDWDHFVWLVVVGGRESPVLLGAVVPFLDASSFCFLLVFLFEADVAMHPIYFVLLALIAEGALLMGVSFSLEGFLIDDTSASLQLSDLFFVMLVLQLKFVCFFC